jgi:hypothetical protein
MRCEQYTVCATGRETAKPIMHESILSPLLPALLDETYRVGATIWLVPWVKETVEGWMQLVAIINQW